MVNVFPVNTKVPEASYHSIVPPVPVAVNAAEVPEQIETAVAVTGVDGIGFTSTVTGVRELVHPLAVDST